MVEHGKANWDGDWNDVQEDTYNLGEKMGTMMTIVITGRCSVSRRLAKVMTHVAMA